MTSSEREEILRLTSRERERELTREQLNVRGNLPMGEKLKNVEEGSSYGLILEDCRSTLAEKLER